MKKFLIPLFCLFALNAHANWHCSVGNSQEQHWSFTAPTEDGAEAMAKAVCDKHKISKEDCSPDCFDIGVAHGRWHCVVADAKQEHFSYFAPTKTDAEALMQGFCSEHKMTKEQCAVHCLPE